MSAEKSLPEHSGFGQHHLDDLTQIIAKYGQAVQSVGVPGTKCSCCDEPVEDDGEPPFTYTVGNHERGMPELLIVGFLAPGPSASPQPHGSDAAGSREGV